MMHPAFRETMVRHNERELDRRVRKAFLWRERPHIESASAGTVTVRLCCVRDDDALERLAALEGRPASRGRHVVAEIDGVVVAALPLAGGRPLRDPFVATAHVMSLLELRAKQLDDEPRTAFSLRWLFGRPDRA